MWHRYFRVMLEFCASFRWKWLNMSRKWQVHYSAANQRCTVFETSVTTGFHLTAEGLPHLSTGRMQSRIIADRMNFLMNSYPWKILQIIGVMPPKNVRVIPTAIPWVIATWLQLTAIIKNSLEQESISQCKMGKAKAVEKNEWGE